MSNAVHLSRLLDLPQLRELGINLSRQRIHNLMREGRFPQSFKLVAGGRNYWFADEIDEFIAARAGGRLWKPTRRTAGPAPHLGLPSGGGS